MLTYAWSIWHDTLPHIIYMYVWHTMIWYIHQYGCDIHNNWIAWWLWWYMRWMNDLYMCHVCECTYCITEWWLWHDMRNAVHQYMHNTYHTWMIRWCMACLWCITMNYTCHGMVNMHHVIPWWICMMRMYMQCIWWTSLIHTCMRHLPPREL